MRESMKRTIWAAMAVTLMQGTLYAGGGKNMAPVEAPVVSIEAIDPSPWYVGVGLISYCYEGCNISSTCTFEEKGYGLMARAGYEYNEYIGVEARAMWAGWDAPYAALEHHVGIFLKPMLPISEDFNLYGLLGYGHTKIDGDYARAAMDESGFSWGIGLEYDLSEKKDDRIVDANYDREFDGQADQEKGWGLFIDYQQLLVNKQNVSGADVDLCVISFGVTYDF